jgi:glycine/D-amino acid oxidase-like deaminating enzyme
MDGVPTLDARFSARDRALTALRNVFYAFGHGHVGLTLSAITAQLVAMAEPFDGIANC